MDLRVRDDSAWLGLFLSFYGRVFRVWLAAPQSSVFLTCALGFCATACSGGGDKGSPVRILPARSQSRVVLPRDEPGLCRLLDRVRKKEALRKWIAATRGMASNSASVPAGGGGAVSTGQDVKGVAPRPLRPLREASVKNGELLAKRNRISTSHIAPLTGTRDEARQAQ